MKRLSYITIVVAAICLVSSCNTKPKTREQQIDEFRAELTDADTTAMLKLADEAMEQLKAKKIDQVLASLYEYDDSTKEVSPLSETTIRRYMRQFKNFPVLDYQREYYTFMLEGCNDVRYAITFATAEQAGTKEPAKTYFMFNPVKVDGEWKLCVKTARDDFDKDRYSFKIHY